MRVYFTASQPCALRLGGAMLGFCGGHEKFVDVDPESKTLAEFIPENADLLPADLVLEKSFFQSPPAFCDVYRYGFAVHLHIREFSARYSGISVLVQERVCGALVTLYKNGGIQLSIEKTDGFYTESLPAAFADAQIFSETVGGKELIFLAAAEGEDTLLFIYDGTRPLFKNRVLSYAAGELLSAKLAFRDCAGHIAESGWKLDNGRFALASYTVRERDGFEADSLDEKLLPFAFFQTFLARGDYRKYLSPELIGRADDLKDYLGNFADVCIPPSAFYLHCGKINATGLVYPAAENVFDVKFFSLEIKSGKICNILPVEI